MESRPTNHPSTNPEPLTQTPFVNLGERLAREGLSHPSLHQGRAQGERPQGRKMHQQKEQRHQYPAPPQVPQGAVHGIPEIPIVISRSYKRVAIEALITGAVLTTMVLIGEAVVGRLRLKA